MLRMMRAMLLISLFSLTLMSTCERATKVKLAPGNPPTFSLSGNGTLGDLIIYGPKQRDINSDRRFALWEIEPINGFMNGRSIASISTIKYGVVPEGYKQIYPENGASPPALVEGPKYEYWFQSINAPHARAYFEIRDNKAIELP